MPAVTRKKASTRTRPELDADVITRISDAIRIGVPLKYASMQAGFGETTIQDWLREHDTGTDRNGQPLKSHRVALVAALADSIQEARGDFVATSTANISTQGQTDWRASSWLLSHQPETKEEYSDAGRVRIEVERHLTVMTNVLQRELAPADYERVLLALGEAQSFQEVA